MIKISRGTTPTITYSFKVVNPADIIVAYLTIEQLGAVLIEKTIDAATIGPNSLSWTLTQAETLKINQRVPCEMQLRYRLRDQSAHVTEIARFMPGMILKDGEI